MIYICNHCSPVSGDVMDNYESDALPTELSRRMFRRVYVSVYNLI